MCVVDTQEGSLALDHSTVRCSPGPRLLQEEDPDPGMVGTWESVVTRCCLASDPGPWLACPQWLSSEFHLEGWCQEHRKLLHS